MGGALASPTGPEVEDEDPPDSQDEQAGDPALALSQYFEHGSSRGPLNALGAQFGAALVDE
jgi:hypothetical protein